MNNIKNLRQPWENGSAKTITLTPLKVTAWDECGNSSTHTFTTCQVSFVEDGYNTYYVLSGGKLSFRRADILSEQNGVCIIAKEPPKAPEAETETGTGTEAPDGTNGPETSSDTIADTAGVTSAETGDDGPGYPKLNDIIIISGDGLYDGKVIG